MLVGLFVVGVIAILIFAAVHWSGTADGEAERDVRHGSARWGDLKQLRALGFVAPGDSAHTAGFPLAHNRWRDGGGEWQDQIIHYPREGHDLIVGAPRSGKLTSALSLILLNDDGKNAIVIDPKGGELARFTSLYRRGIGETVFIDPCGIMHAQGQPFGTYCINPLDLVRSAKDKASAANELADAMVPATVGSKDPFWEDSARDAISCLILHLATESSRANATLLDLLDIFAGEIDREVLLEMADNPAGGGKVQRFALELIATDQRDNPWRSVKRSITTAIKFLEHEGVQRSLAATNYDYSKLRTGRVTVYVVLPNASLGPWLRLVYRTLMMVTRDIEGAGIHVVVDEFAALGRFDKIVDEDLPTLAGLGFHMHLAVQDLPQLLTIYGEGWQRIWSECAVRRVLGVNDLMTAKYVSELLGQQTVESEQETVTSSTDGRSVSRSTQYHGRALMTPDEVAAMSRDHWILFLEGVDPQRLHKSHYYQTAPWSARWSDLTTLRGGSAFRGDRGGPSAEPA